MSVDTVGSHVHCHYCGRTAALTVDRDGIRVGLCEAHFRERLHELAEHWPATLSDEIVS